MRIVPLGRRVVKRGERVYEYRYLPLDVDRFPEVRTAYRLQLIIAPPDLSAPPAVIVARLFQRSARTRGFDVAKKFQPILDKYNRDGFVAVLAVEVVEEDKGVEAGGT